MHGEVNEGTTVNLPIHKTTILHFGILKDAKLCGKTVMANACMLYDVLNNYVLASNISPPRTGEKNILSKLIIEVALNNSIVILDRGFCSFSIFKIFKNNGLYFCIRLRTL